MYHILNWPITSLFYFASDSVLSHGSYKFIIVFRFTVCYSTLWDDCYYGSDCCVNFSLFLADIAVKDVELLTCKFNIWSSRWRLSLHCY